MTVKGPHGQAMMPEGAVVRPDPGAMPLRRPRSFVPDGCRAEGNRCNRLLDEIRHEEEFSGREHLEHLPA